MKNTTAVDKGYLFFLQMKKEARPEFEKALGNLSFKDRIVARKFLLSCRNFESDGLVTWCSKFPYPESVSIALSQLSEAMMDLAEHYKMAWFTRKNGRLVSNGSGKHKVVLPTESTCASRVKRNEETWKQELYKAILRHTKNMI